MYLHLVDDHGPNMMERSRYLYLHIVIYKAKGCRTILRLWCTLEHLDSIGAQREHPARPMCRKGSMMNCKMVFDLSAKSDESTSLICEMVF